MVVGGENDPIVSRAELDEIEKNFVKRSYPEMNLVKNADLFDPKLQSQGQRIQEIRENNWQTIGNDYERTWEIVINEKSKKQIDSDHSRFGANTIAVLLKHAEVENSVWATSLPSINRLAVLKRIMVVNDDVVSSSKGGWSVVNDTNYGWGGQTSLTALRVLYLMILTRDWSLTRIGRIF